MVVNHFTPSIAKHISSLKAWLLTFFCDPNPSFLMVRSQRYSNPHGWVPTPMFPARWIPPISWGFSACIFERQTALRGVPPRAKHTAWQRMEAHGRHDGRAGMCWGWWLQVVVGWGWWLMRLDSGGETDPHLHVQRKVTNMSGTKMTLGDDLYRFVIL